MKPDAYLVRINGELSSIASKRAALDAREAFLRSELTRITEHVARPTSDAGPYVVCKDNARHTPDYLNAAYQYEVEAHAKPRIFKQAKRAADAARATGGYIKVAPIWALKDSA